MEIVAEAEVDTYAVTHVRTSKDSTSGFSGKSASISFETGGDELVAGHLFIDYEFFDVYFTWKWSVEADPDVSDFGESRCRIAATRVSEFEVVVRHHLMTGLRRRHTLEIP